MRISLPARASRVFLFTTVMVAMGYGMSVAAAEDPVHLIISTPSPSPSPTVTPPPPTPSPVPSPSPTPPAPTPTPPCISGTPREIGQCLAARRGWTSGNGEWQALERLWTKESGWRTNAYGPRTRKGRACGIAQRLPCNGYDRLSAYDQIELGLDYIQFRKGSLNRRCGTPYGRPSVAWAHFRRCGWY